MRRIALYLLAGSATLTGAFGAMSDTAGGSERVTYSSGQPSRPTFIKTTLHAIAPHGASSSSIPNFQPVGTVVPASDIVTTAADTSRLHYGLAVFRNLMSATYPAISNDGGATWRIDGPQFYVAAAHAASFIGSVGKLHSHGAYFWGRGSNFVWVTTDEGVHWLATGFASGVDKVSTAHGSLRTVALGNQVKDGSFQAFLYVSTDSGRTWRLQGELRNVKV